MNLATVDNRVVEVLGARKYEEGMEGAFYLEDTSVEDDLSSRGHGFHG
jgi:hypothetical protein